MNDDNSTTYRNIDALVTCRGIAGRPLLGTTTWDGLPGTLGRLPRH